MKIKPLKLFAGIDLGTSGCRLIVIDEDNKIQSSSAISYSNPDNQTPELWWTSVQELLKNLPIEIKNKLLSIAVDGTSGSVLLCDDEGNPLTSTLMYNDLRATKEAMKIKQILPKNNGGQGASGSLSRLLWLLDNELNISQHINQRSAQKGQKGGGCAFHVVHQADYILGKLINDYSISDENNCLKLGYDVINQCWPVSLLKKLGIESEWLPKVYPAGTAVSTMDSHVVKRLDLPSSLKVVTGTTDSIAAFIATGANAIGDAVSSLGSTLVLKLVSDKPIFSPEHGIYSHRLNNQWLVGGASNSGAKVLLHYFSQDQLDKMTADLVPENKTGLHYYPLIDKGERFPLADANKLSKLSPRPADDIVFFQGILEGISHIEKQGYQKLVELGAAKVTSVRSVGGGSKNNAWTKIRETSLKVDMITPSQTEAAYGSALLAQQGAMKGL